MTIIETNTFGSSSNHELREEWSTTESTTTPPVDNNTDNDPLLFTTTNVWATATPVVVPLGTMEAHREEMPDSTTTTTTTCPIPEAQVIPVEPPAPTTSTMFQTNPSSADNAIIGDGSLQETARLSEISVDASKEPDQIVTPTRPMVMPHRGAGVVGMAAGGAATAGLVAAVAVPPPSHPRVQSSASSTCCNDACSTVACCAGVAECGQCLFHAVGVVLCCCCECLAAVG